ncbi:TonB-dependent receptor [Candidatus Phycosocius spiralis]|uniref:TonB-dependent receptor n=1 Tax=Candidatus Phycosocius spiralis TaxID=2815099 RepID=A0ABQ4PTS6_9PROT|nr:TonB-dependent receptor [Candidatus Phycosocius spiralis]GIU66394.1 TonB-dependent receptor [Candidatus Phycosocius spiralis]
MIIFLCTALFLCATGESPPPQAPEAGLVQEAPIETLIVRAERLIGGRVARQSLTATQLEQASGSRLDEALRAMPSVGLFRRTPSGSANATIQGLSLRPIAPNGAGRALVSLDGVPQNDPFGSWIVWARYDPLFLERVDILRGGAGAGFGALALTGTLDLVEARGGPSKLRLTAGGAGSRAAAARASAQAGPAVLTGMISYEHRDGFIPVIPASRGPVDIGAGFEVATVTIVSEVPDAQGSWAYRVSGFSEEKGAGTIGAQSKSLGADFSLARRWEGAWGQGRVQIYSQVRDFSNQTNAISADRTSQDPAVDQFETPASALGGSLAFAPQWQGLHPRLTLDWRHSQGQTSELFRYQRSDFTRSRLAGGSQNWLGGSLEVPDLITDADQGTGLDMVVRLDRWANFSARRYEFDRTTGQSTLRENGRDVQGLVPTGRLIAYAGQRTVELSAYRSFRPPSLNELHRPFRVGNDVTEPDPALKPEILEGVDLDLKGQFRGFGVETSALLTLYANRLYDPVANVTLASGPGVFDRVGFLPAGGTLRQRRNVGRIDATGMEASLTWVAETTSDASGRKPSGRVSVSLTDATVDGAALLPQLTGKRPAQAAPWAVYIDLSLPIGARTSYEFTLRGEGARFEDDLNTRKLKAYHAFDVRAQLDLAPGRQLFVIGENIGGSRIATALSGTGVLSESQNRLLRIGISLTQ